MDLFDDEYEIVPIEPVDMFDHGDHEASPPDAGDGFDHGPHDSWVDFQGDQHQDDLSWTPHEPDPIHDQPDHVELSDTGDHHELTPEHIETSPEPGDHHEVIDWDQPGVSDTGDHHEPTPEHIEISPEPGDHHEPTPEHIETPPEPGDHHEVIDWDQPGVSDTGDHHEPTPEHIEISPEPGDHHEPTPEHIETPPEPGDHHEPTPEHIEVLPESGGHHEVIDWDQPGVFDPSDHHQPTPEHIETPPEPGDHHEPTPEHIETPPEPGDHHEPTPEHIETPPEPGDHHEPTPEHIETPPEPGDHHEPTPEHIEVLPESGGHHEVIDWDQPGVFDPSDHHEPTPEHIELPPEPGDHHEPTPEHIETPPEPGDHHEVIGWDQPGVFDPSDHHEPVHEPVHESDPPAEPLTDAHEPAWHFDLEQHGDGSPASEWFDAHHDDLLVASDFEQHGDGPPESEWLDAHHDDLLVTSDSQPDAHPHPQPPDLQLDLLSEPDHSQRAAADLDDDFRFTLAEPSDEPLLPDAVDPVSALGAEPAPAELAQFGELMESPRDPTLVGDVGRGWAHAASPTGPPKWDPSRPPDTPSKEGNYPTWRTVRARSWKRMAYLELQGRERGLLTQRDPGLLGMKPMAGMDDDQLRKILKTGKAPTGMELEHRIPQRVVGYLVDAGVDPNLARRVAGLGDPANLMVLPRELHGAFDSYARFERNPSLPAALDDRQENPFRSATAAELKEISSALTGPGVNLNRTAGRRVLDLLNDEATRRRPKG